MVTPLILAVCVPGDFYNPYPSLFWSATVCAALLGFELFILSRTARNYSQVLSGLWFRRIRNLLSIFVLCTAMVACGLAIWLGWQSLHFVTLCTIGGFSFTILAFEVGVYGVGVIMALTALSIVEVLPLLAVQFWLSKTIQRAR
jgi:hypothetical protein